MVKSILFLLFNSLKWAKFSKIFFSAGSILLSLGTYAMIYGWPYAAGFVGLIFVHEMGHYCAARQRQLDVGLPTFIPFVGAFIQLKDMPKSAETDAYVALAGPYMGTFAAFACYFWGQHTHSGLWMALAQAGFMINLFNLIPLYPLDGGRITAIIHPRIWFLGVPILLALWWHRPSPMLIMVAIMAVPQLLKAWKLKGEDQQDYYTISGAVRFEYAVLYLGLAAVLAMMIKEI